MFRSLVLASLLFATTATTVFADTGATCYSTPCLQQAMDMQKTLSLNGIADATVQQTVGGDGAVSYSVEVTPPESSRAHMIVDSVQAAGHSTQAGEGGGGGGGNCQL